MINNGISPDEISVLLGKRKPDEKTMQDPLLSRFEMEALAEVLNVSFGSTKALLSGHFSKPVSILAPLVSIKKKNELLNDIVYPSFVVLGQYSGAINGIEFLFFNKEIFETTSMDMSSDAEKSENQFQIVQEVAQQMFRTASHAMSAVLDLELSQSVSVIDLIESSEEEFQVDWFTEDESFVQAVFPLIAGNQENLSFTLSFPVNTARQMVGVLSAPIDDFGMEEEFQFMNESNETNQLKNSGTKIQAAQFSSFDESPSQHSEPNNIDLLLDIPLQVTVELGRTKRMVKEILEVSPGSIIELDKLAGEPVDILVNNKLIAVGEVVVIDDNFGVRVTDILSTVDRISKLR